MSSPPNPNHVMCVVTLNGREIGRIAAAATNATQYLDSLCRTYREECERTKASIKVQYVEDKEEAGISQLLHHAMHCSRYVLLLSVLLAGCKTDTRTEYQKTVGVGPISAGNGWWELDLKKTYGADDIRIKMVEGKVSPDFDGKIYFHKK